ncbi:hypothetical protein SAMN02745248_00022 [Hathewaya proteolytica DSM 3090]|uniref:Uncharacterized protein n=1 Tax=Hathewaya proteolytica DSM 3090 TaxID=1121331 RepID=A0A1M6J2X6_9CLOT|nr:hypothetical protein [Hathewaya proteolytica]SHJ41017.1 hypothetical protein SAMN02745248_00022 [Hathewaya proteolytica DSM 3090]
MIEKCHKCHSLDIVDVDGVLMCNNCGEILNGDCKKEISIKIDSVEAQNHAESSISQDDDLNIEALENLNDEDDLSEEEIGDFQPFSDLSYLLDSEEEMDSDQEDVLNREGQWCFIDDVDDLAEDLSYEDYNNAYEEKYPGLLIRK